jgi:hypothetical protein
MHFTRYVDVGAGKKTFSIVNIGARFTKAIKLIL